MNAAARDKFVGWLLGYLDGLGEVREPELDLISDRLDIALGRKPRAERERLRAPTAEEVAGPDPFGGGWQSAKSDTKPPPIVIVIPEQRDATARITENTGPSRYGVTHWPRSMNERFDELFKRLAALETEVGRLWGTVKI